MKKFLLIIVVALCLPVTMWAYDFEVDGIYYRITSESTVAVAEPNEMNTLSDINVPSTVTNEATGLSYTVTSVDEYAYFPFEAWSSKAGSLKTVELPNTIETVGKYAFRSAGSLISAYIPTGTTIGECAFAYCYDLETVTLPVDLVTLGSQVFANCTELSTIILLNPHMETAWDYNDFPAQYMTLSVPESAYDYYVNLKNSGSSDWQNALAWFTITTFSDAVTVEIEATDNEGDGYATYYNADYDITLPHDVDAYTASNVDSYGVITMNHLDSGTIPAKTAVLLKGVPGTYEVTATDPNATAPTTNLFYASSEETTTNVNGETDGYYFYKLTVDADTESKLGFYWGAADGAAFTMPANKAWLAIPRPSQQDEEDEGYGPYGVPALTFNFDGEETTGITSVATPATSAPAGIYSLQGVRVSDMSQKGVYIVDGKKVIVK